MEYQEWLDHNTTLGYQENNWEVLQFAEEAWNFKESKLQSMIQRIEEYPTCMSCYATVEEMNAAKAMKETILKILKEEK